MACDYVNSAFEPDENGRKTRELLAVCVRDAWKGYGTIGKMTPVLEGLNMSVKLGSIYALLGPSGCGKTTLLACIVARKQLDQGSITVYGQSPGVRGSGVPGWRVGYMPQDLAVYKECTISEMFSFFGRIYNMNSKSIKKQLEFSTDFLEIPKHSRRVKSLSGGQQRRVSFALTLIHNPQLLILDEPTVGVDPILRAKIWKFLLGKAESGLHTIIITTHYIEEARQADMVGMLHAGKLLAEKPPNYLLEKHNVSTLEEVFYKYCIDFETHGTVMIENAADENSGVEQVTSECVPPCNGSAKALMEQFQGREDTLFERATHSFNRISAVYVRAYGRLIGNPFLFLFITLVPPFIVGTFAFAFGSDVKGLPVAIYNGEHPTEQICMFPNEDCFFGNLSCRLLDALDTELMELIPYPNASAAEKALSDRDVRAAIIFPSNYSDSLVSSFSSGLDLEGYGASNSSKITLMLDQSHFIVSALISRAMFYNFIQFLRNTFEVCETDPLFVQLPVLLHDPIPENANVTFVHFFMGPLMMFMSFIIAAVFATVHFIADRQEGVLDRIAVTGVTALELLVGLALHQFTNNLLQLVSMFIVAFGMYSTPYNSGILSVFSICAMQGACGLAFGFMVAVSFYDEKAAYQFILALLYIITVFGGIVWPIEALPQFMRVGSLSMPTTWAMNSARDLMLRDWGIAYKLVWPGFAITTAWTAIFITLTYISLKTVNKF